MHINNGREEDGEGRKCVSIFIDSHTYTLTSIAVDNNRWFDDWCMEKLDEKFNPPKSKQNNQRFNLNIIDKYLRKLLSINKRIQKTTINTLEQWPLSTQPNPRTSSPSPSQSEKKIESYDNKRRENWIDMNEWRVEAGTGMWRHKQTPWFRIGKKYINDREKQNQHFGKMNRGDFFFALGSGWYEAVSWPRSSNRYRRCRQHCHRRHTPCIFIFFICIFVVFVRILSMVKMPPIHIW